MNASCPFCRRLAAGEVDRRRGSAACFADGFPVARGHTLVVSSRHEPDFFSLHAREQADIWALVSEVRDRLARKVSPDGFNVGLNSGSAAGQTVAHAHVHVIPRFAGDVDDPRGGIRRVIPGRADYWSRP